MTISISPDLEAQVREKARSEGLSVNAYVERLIREDEEWREFMEPRLDLAHPEFAEVQAAVTEGLEQAERGEARPAEEVFSRLRAKHGISR